MRAAIIASVAAVSASGFAGTVPAAASTAGTTPAPKCFSLPATVHDPESGRGLWTYVHSVSWCGDQVSITSTVPPRIEVSTTGAACVWQGVKSQRTDLRATSWKTTSMGEFACTGPDGMLWQVNPWVIVTAYPNGGYDAETGTTVSVVPPAPR